MEKIINNGKLKWIVLLLILFFTSQIFAAPCGDVNSDGVINIVDALMTAQFYVGLNPQPFDQSAAEVSGDGTINIIDALQIAQYYVGLIPLFEGCNPTPTPDTTPCQSQTYELQAETEATWDDATVDDNYPGWTGTGFVNTANSSGRWIEWTVDVSADSSATCVFTYANGSTSSRSMDLSINGSVVTSLNFSVTGSWDTWSTDEASVILTDGPNAIRLTATNSAGAPNMDRMDITIDLGCIITPAPTPTPTPTPVPGQISLYRVFERTLTNDKNYSNKFTDVELLVSYTSPSGKNTDFRGFFDGDGKGGGNMSSGNVWKMRFMPDETGTWNYTWSWSDGTPGGQGEFSCTSAGAGKGILQAYQDNPRWFAYNGTDPVYIKSYYESSMRPFMQPWDCAKNIYQALLDNGYNYLMVNWLLPSVSGENLNCSSPSSNKAIYEEEGKASTTMNLDVWNKMEVLLSWLNDKNVSLFMFLGFDGGRNGKPQAWASLSAAEQDFFVRYVVARIAPYAIITWNYVWEVAGDTENGELGCMRLVQKYDVFNHLRTYQDEWPRYNEFSRPEYTFAGVENHRIHSDEREPEYWCASWTYHEAILLGYVPGKPVYMVEGNVLWRRFWFNHIKKVTGHSVTQEEVRQAAWATATAAGSFTWCGHTSLSLSGSSGLPFFDGQGNSYRAAANAIDLLTDIMNTKVEFYEMTPQDNLLSGHDSLAVWCLAEGGKQYLVFASNGKNFTLNLEAGQYTNNLWIDAKTGNEQAAPSVTGGTTSNFTPPDTSTDWVLILRL